MACSMFRGCKMSLVRSVEGPPLEHAYAGEKFNGYIRVARTDVDAGEWPPREAGDVSKLVAKAITMTPIRKSRLLPSPTLGRMRSVESLLSNITENSMSSVESTVSHSASSLLDPRKVNSTRSDLLPPNTPASLKNNQIYIPIRFHVDLAVNQPIILQISVNIYMLVEQAPAKRGRGLAANFIGSLVSAQYEETILRHVDSCFFDVGVKIALDAALGVQRDFEGHVYVSARLTCRGGGSDADDFVDCTNPSMEAISSKVCDLSLDDAPSVITIKDLQLLLANVKSEIVPITHEGVENQQITIPPKRTYTALFSLSPGTDISPSLRRKDEQSSFYLNCLFSLDGCLVECSFCESVESKLIWPNDLVDYDHNLMVSVDYSSPSPRALQGGGPLPILWPFDYKIQLVNVSKHPISVKITKLLQTKEASTIVHDPAMQSSRTSANILETYFKPTDWVVSMRPQRPAYEWIKLDGGAVISLLFPLLPIKRGSFELCGLQLLYFHQHTESHQHTFFPNTKIKLEIE